MIVMMQGADIRPFAFVLAVRDVDDTAAYFRDALGFAVQWTDATDWRLLSRGKVNVMIGHCPDAAPAAETGDHSYFGYLEVDDVDALHAELAERGAIIRTPPADKPWGLREMLVATPDGHRMVIGRTLALPKAG